MTRRCAVDPRGWNDSDDNDDAITHSIAALGREITRGLFGTRRRR